MDDRSVGGMATMGGAGPRDNRSVGDTRTLRHADVPLGRIDQYELVCELGGGGFGVVYLARDTVAGVDVAVKGLPPLVKNNADELERIRENFALVSKLHHPRIAAALHLQQARDVSYAAEQVRQALRVMQGDTLMVMAYAPGVTLNKWRKQFPEGKVPVAQALEVCRQIAEALDYAHGEKVVHRDVKPSNVMVETRKTELSVKVLDFGLAAEIRSSMSRVSQEKGDTSGTRPYMAPEQWAGRKQDGRTDQYALAVLFYELVSGAVPFASAFDTGDPVIMANAAENKVPEPLVCLLKAQNAALLRGLAKDAAQRFGSCWELVSVLGGQKTQHAAGSGKPWLRLAGAAILIASLAVAYRTYGTYRADRERARAAAEQAAKLDASQKAKVAGLKASAETALEKGDFEAAGARIAELAQAGGADAAAELRKKYEAKAGERETNKRYAAASLAREEVQKIDGAQGIGEKVKALEAVWREAEAARQGQGWGQALSGYDTVIAECKRLSETDAVRQSAKTRMGVAEKAKTDAESAGTAKDAEFLFAEASRTFSQAMAAFEKGEFEVASKAWIDASGKFAAAQKQAAVVQGYRKAKGNFENALATDSALLTKHGGAKWAEVQKLQKVGNASADQPDKGQLAFKDALAALPEAVKDAERKEAELLAAEREQDRMLKVTAALTATRSAKMAGEWQLCAGNADEALALDAGNTEARALKEEAKRNLLIPKLTVTVSADGREVEADISDGRQTYRTPHSFTLQPDMAYSFIVSYKTPSSSVHYKDTKLAVTADWNGPCSRRVELEKHIGPFAGEAWTSPSTGMECVWVPALKMWVGKYEVTNGEYRKKVPGHDSRHDEGLVMNGDRQPVVFVNYVEAKAYAAWLTERDRDSLDGMRYRLPSEAEWLGFAQCGDGRTFPWGNELPPKYGNYADRVALYKSKFKMENYFDGFAVTCPVERSGMNEWGLYGVGGNVREWCSSDESGELYGAVRGASYRDRDDSLRCSCRLDMAPASNAQTFCDGNIGFRLVLSR